MHLNPIFFQFKLWFILMSPDFPFIVKQQNAQEHTTHIAAVQLSYLQYCHYHYIYCLVTVLELGNVSLVLAYTVVDLKQITST